MLYAYVLLEIKLISICCNWIWSGTDHLIFEGGWAISSEKEFF